VRNKLALIAAFAAWVILAVGTTNFAQKKPDEASSIHLNKPWTDGTPEEAQAAANVGLTIPLSTYSLMATKDPIPKNKKLQPRTGTIVGTDPFAVALSGSTISAVVVPLIIKIGAVTFDPTAPNNCDPTGYSSLQQFMGSPLVQPVQDLTLNGVDVGNVQYTDGVMRAEFWGAIHGSPLYTNPLSFTTTPVVTIDATAYGTTGTTACGDILGVVNEGSLNTQLRSALQSLTPAYVSTNKVVFFLTHNVSQSTVNPPSLPGSPGCCIGGYHTATGSPPQFWAIMDSKTDIGISSHEIGELMNDPLGSNSTPLWGGIGQVAAGSCQGNFEVGDPLTGTTMAITLNSYTYHPQELAFFSWFFNAQSTVSIGAGGMFSSNGTFAGPAKACPPGGTY
jgi:hypothetical protein